MAQKNSAMAGLTGAVIGAAAAAAAIALSDEKNRKKAEGILNDLRKEGDKILKEITKKALELKDMGDKALSKPKKQPKRIKAKSTKKRK